MRRTPDTPSTRTTSRSSAANRRRCGARGDIAPMTAAPEKSEAAMIVVAPHRPLKQGPDRGGDRDRPASGPLPRIGADGKKPFDVYSQVTPLAVTHPDRPKITLVLGGMGLNAQAHPEGHRHAAGRRDAGLRALWRQSAGAGEQGARRRATRSCCRCRWSRWAIPATIPGPSTLLSDASARAEPRGAEMADEPLRRLFRHHQLHGRAPAGRPRRRCGR